MISSGQADTKTPTSVLTVESDIPFSTSQASRNFENLRNIVFGWKILGIGLEYGICLYMDLFPSFQTLLFGGESKMRLFLYKLLTQGIIILGALRSKLEIKSVIRRDRTFKNPSDQFFSIECCDCGLIHFRQKKKGLEQPIRPEGYDYSWRKYAPMSSTFKPEGEW